MNKARSIRNVCDSRAKEWRRLRALHLKEAGWKQRDIATAMDVTEGAVSQWMAAARVNGPAALHSRMAHGCLPKLTPEQKRLIPDCLWHGTEAYGFRGEFWTCRRVANILEQEFCV